MKKIVITVVFAIFIIILGTNEINGYVAENYMGEWSDSELDGLVGSDQAIVQLVNTRENGESGNSAIQTDIVYDGIRSGRRRRTS